MQDVTSVWAPTIAGLLMADRLVAGLDFPSLAPQRRTYWAHGRQCGP